jgi:hypothetical protein
MVADAIGKTTTLAVRFAQCLFTRTSHEGERRDWCGRVLRAQGPSEDVWHVLRQACPESSIEILGHLVDGISYRHHANRAPLAFKAIMTIPQPPAFSALIIKPRHTNLWANSETGSFPS